MSKKAYVVVGVIITAVIATTAVYLIKPKTVTHGRRHVIVNGISGEFWPDTNKLTDNNADKLIKYGRDLVINTSFYLGPKGVVVHKSNGMNCQNCHLSAGTKLFGNNFSMVANSYPKYRERSGTIESMTTKVEDCFKRSLNGEMVDSNGREIKAILAYLKWVGKNVPKHTKVKGAGTEELPFLSRPTDTARGRIVYMAKCKTCHQKNGQGVINLAGTGYKYPPLWGSHSYNIGASIYRISKLAGFVKNNMPFGVQYKKSQLSNEEAWDVAAFVNSQYHPYKNTGKDWPKLSTKPFDCPTGPYADHFFSESQHKYGPYAPIKQYYSQLNKSLSHKD